MATQLLSHSLSKKQRGRFKKAPNSQMNPQNRFFVVCLKRMDGLSVPLLLIHRDSSQHTWYNCKVFETCPKIWGGVCIVSHNAIFQTQIKPVLQNPQPIPCSLNWNPLTQLQCNTCSLKKGKENNHYQKAKSCFKTSYFRSLPCSLHM